MSAKIMADVLLKSNTKGNAKLVLLTIAYYTHDDGTGARPSLTTITHHTGLSRRTVCAMLDYLSTTGHLIIESTHGKHGTNLYAIPSLGQFSHYEQTRPRENPAPLGQALPRKQTEKKEKLSGAGNLLGKILPQQNRLEPPAPTDPAYQRGLRLLEGAVTNQQSQMIQDARAVLADEAPTLPRVVGTKPPPPESSGQGTWGSRCTKDPTHIDTDGETWRVLPSTNCYLCKREQQRARRARYRQQATK